MKTLVTTIALSLLLLVSARADVQVFFSPEFVWIATDAQIAALKPLAPGKKPSVSEEKMKRDAVTFAKRQTHIRDWEAHSCELVDSAVPGLNVFLVTLNRSKLQTAADIMYVVGLQDGTILVPRAK
jgi:hypothetical protein